MPAKPPVKLMSSHGPWPGHDRRTGQGTLGYFLFLRWMRVFFSSLRCFFLAIRLRRFLMTEPMRPPLSAQRQTGTPSRSTRYGKLGTRPKVDKTARTTLARAVT